MDRLMGLTPHRTGSLIIVKTQKIMADVTP